MNRNDQQHECKWCKTTKVSDASTLTLTGGVAVDQSLRNPVDEGIQNLKDRGVVNYFNN